MESVPGDYSKRVYQGVRVKHTVKDLLAEKRSRQTSNSRFNGNTNSSPSPFVQMPGSPATSSYYGIRRSFLSDSDFHSKQFSNDGYSSTLAKPFSCESSTTQNYPPILDSYFSEPYGDYRPAALTPNTSSFFGASSLPSTLLQPHFSSDSTHFVFRDSWEQTVPDSLNQTDVGSSDPLQTLPVGSNCLSPQESGSPSQHRSSTWGTALPGAQSYSLHALEDLHYPPGYPAPSSYSFTPFMTVTNDLTPKVIQLSSDDSLDTTSLHENPSWTKDDGNGEPASKLSLLQLQHPAPSRLLHRMSEKPKVYQGVRVKITVKELLQQRRAHQAASGGTLSRSSSVQFSEAVSPSSAAPYFEPEPISPAPNYFQPRQFSSCMSCEENPSCLNQVFESYLPTETLLDQSFSSTQGAPTCFQDSFQATPFCFNQSLVPGSPSDSSTLSSPLEYSYSPPQQPTLAPVTYSSPSSLDTRHCGYPPEDYSHHHFHSHPQYSCCASSSSSSVCYCTSCETEHLDTIKLSEFFSYPDTDCIDYSHSLPSAVADDFYRREADCDICYS